MSQFSSTTDRRFMSSDERGSIVSLTDSSGALLTINRYDEYGKPQSTNSGRFQYTGQKWLSEIGAYDYKARVYLPHLGIFAQTDPIGYDAGANVYAYVLDDPVNETDPLGLSCAGGPVGTTGEDCTDIIVTAARKGREPWAANDFLLVDLPVSIDFAGGGIPRQHMLETRTIADSRSIGARGGRCCGRGHCGSALDCYCSAFLAP